MSAAELWHKAIAVYQSRGMTKAQAMTTVTSKHPLIHECFIMESNLGQLNARDREAAKRDRRIAKSTT